MFHLVTSINWNLSLRELLDYLSHNLQIVLISMVHSFNNNRCLPMMKADEVLLFYENKV